ncbi:NlpC/P60 family protein [Cohnella cholangitidis]|uniref:NlpC/P60 family protein n=1 Tax=Cohnella cholangitidis TaxID=2598458 RepID=UPI002D2191EB|nr:NlpC/P60 family protein [Cohnella cholangitidis]
MRSSQGRQRSAARPASERRFAVLQRRGLDIGHVGIYVGDNRILHTYSKEQGVHFEEFSDKWKKRFVTARRMF